MLVNCVYAKKTKTIFAALTALALVLSGFVYAVECRPYNLVREVADKEVSDTTKPKLQEYDVIEFDASTSKFKGIKQVRDDALVPYCDLEGINYDVVLQKPYAFGSGTVYPSWVKSGSLDFARAGIENAFSEGLKIKLTQHCPPTYCSCKFKLAVLRDGQQVNLDLDRKETKESKKAKQGVLKEDVRCSLEETWLGEYRARESKAPNQVLEKCRTDLMPGSYSLGIEAENIEPRACRITTRESCKYGYGKDSDEAVFELREKDCDVSREYFIESSALVSGLHSASYSDEKSDWDELNVFGVVLSVEDVKPEGLSLRQVGVLPSNMVLKLGTTEVMSKDLVLPRMAVLSVEKKIIGLPVASATIQFSSVEARAEYPFTVASVKVDVSDLGKTLSGGYKKGREVIGDLFNTLW